MRLNQQTDLAMRVLIHVALCPERRVTIDEIATAYAISRNHLMKIVHQLARSGFLITHRGSGGGMKLGHRPEEIRLDSVVLCMETDFALVECFRPGNRCVITPACALSGILDRARQAFIDALARYTLADLLARDRVATLARLLNIRG